jgi:hypothetical protein
MAAIFLGLGLFESDFVFPGLSLKNIQMIKMKTIPSRNQDLRSTLVSSHTFIKTKCFL